jgi:hypothetical protein
MRTMGASIHLIDSEVTTSVDGLIRCPFAPYAFHTDKRVIEPESQRLTSKVIHLTLAPL